MLVLNKIFSSKADRIRMQTKFSVILQFVTALVCKNFFEICAKTNVINDIGIKLDVNFLSFCLTK